MDIIAKDTNHLEYYKAIKYTWKKAKPLLHYKLCSFKTNHDETHE